ncbi:MAG: hypothetical protein KQH63_00465 [Desulfobulbaceae bacterium]|nr:hypothetical protein [Desulfobulbaceae bacterium]
MHVVIVLATIVYGDEKGEAFAVFWFGGAGDFETFLNLIDTVCGFHRP